MTEFDSAGLQLLLAACATAAGQGLPLRLAQPSPAVRNTLALFGLDEALTAGRA